MSAAREVVRALRLLAALLVERIRRHPLRALLLSHVFTLSLALHAASRPAGGLRALLVRLLLRAARATPVVRGQLVRMKAQARERIERMVAKDLGATTAELPADGLPEAHVCAQLREWAAAETSWAHGRVSGVVYSGDERLTRLIAEAARLYALSNPLHPDVFPSVRKMEAEVVAMCAALFRCPALPDACGTMTSGGSESIVLAAKAHRDLARATRGIVAPEMVIPSTAHAAFLKAGHCLGIRVVRVPVTAGTFRADARAMERALSANTVLLVGSAPSFAQGVIDPIDELSAVALRHGVGLHVDCCAGSLLLPFLKALGRPAPPCDFALPGVTSLSLDTHKYGFAPKGSSVVLYRSEELRHAQYFVAPDWTGGIYATPTLAGSRPGAAIAGTWAVMMAMGASGYATAFAQLLSTTDLIADGVRGTAGLALLGTVDTTIVCFGPAPGAAPPVNILAVGDALSARGWSLNTLQHPPCLHLCVTMPHTAEGVAERFIDELRAAVDRVAAAPAGGEEGAACALYGMAELVRETSVVEEVAKTFLDALYKV